MTTFLKRFFICFVFMSMLMTFLFPEEVEINRLGYDSFYNIFLANQDAINQDSNHLKIKTKKSTSVELIDHLQVNGYISGNRIVVYDAAENFNRDIDIPVKENTVELKGQKAFVNINTRIHQIPISISGEIVHDFEVGNLKTEEKTNLINAIAVSFNRYGVTPAKVEVNFNSKHKYGYNILVFKSLFTKIFWSFNEFPIITRFEDLRKFPLYARYHLKNKLTQVQ